MSSAAEKSRENGKKGGRPKDAIQQSSRRLAQRRINEIISTKTTPVDVMLDNMLFWHRKVQTLAEKVEDCLANLDPADKESRKELATLMRTMLSARGNSQKCAIDMAPYCHPRLQAIAIQSQNTHEVKITGGLPMMPSDELAAPPEKQVTVLPPEPTA